MAPILHRIDDSLDRIIELLDRIVDAVAPERPKVEHEEAPAS